MPDTKQLLEEKLDLLFECMISPGTKEIGEWTWITGTGSPGSD